MPTRWKVSPANQNLVIDENHNVAAECDDHRQAAQIVREHNAHEELITACVWALNEMKHPHPDPENKQLTIDQIEAALRLAKGE